jgi:TPR repeat protein
MYAKGQGVRVSELNAYVWATLAADNGNVPAKALADQLRPLLAPGSEKIAEDIRAPYSRAALDARLMPQTPLGAARDPACRPVSQIAPSYPMGSRTRGMQGEVAQFEVGDALMTGWGCRADVDKGLVWLRKAAEADEPNAQVSLASYALRGTPDATGARGAMVWLERAAAHHDSHGTLYLAAVLAATPVTELRNPQRALQLIHGVDAVSEDPTPFEIRAAAQAASGKFADAVRDQRKAIALATSLGWNLAPLKERLARYESRQAWYGNLLTL